MMEEIQDLKWDLHDPWCLVHVEPGCCRFMSNRVLRERNRSSSFQGVHGGLQGNQATTRKALEWDRAICQKSQGSQGRYWGAVMLSRRSLA